MKKNVLYYKTEWGATKQYAEWIDEVVTDLELKDIDDFEEADIRNYYKIVIGSRTYKGDIVAQPFLEENWHLLKNKRVYLFSVGIEPPDAPGSIETYEKIPKEIRDGLAGYVKLMGRVDQEKLTIVQRLIVMKFENSDVDQMDKVGIEPIVSFLKGHEWSHDSDFRYVQ